VQESSVDPDVFLVHMQINVSKPEEVLFIFGTAAAAAQTRENARSWRYFESKQVTKTPCATAVAARARARAASAGNVRGPRRQLYQVVFVPTVLPLMIYKNDDDYIQVSGFSSAPCRRWLGEGEGASC
jgi:hypothetical protein